MISGFAAIPSPSSNLESDPDLTEKARIRNNGIYFQKRLKGPIFYQNCLLTNYLPTLRELHLQHCSTKWEEFKKIKSSIFYRGVKHLYC